MFGLNGELMLLDSLSLDPGVVYQNIEYVDNTYYIDKTNIE